MGPFRCKTQNKKLVAQVRQASGPGGIRTLDLISAIDARSQLRYRPFWRVSEIVPQAGLNVKKIVLECQQNLKSEPITL